MKLSTLLSVGLGVTLTGLVAVAARPKPSEPLDTRHAKTRSVNVSADLPVSFETNQGQSDQRVKFLARGRGYTAFFTPEEVVLALSAPSARQGEGQPDAVVMRTRLVGGDLSPAVEGEHQLPGRANYFTGTDPAAWRTNVATYGRVRYRDVYPGIDVVYYGVSGRLEYDFEVRPGGDPSQIHLHFEGFERLTPDEGGVLLHTKAGTVRHRQPTVYQLVGGERKTVPASFRAISKSDVGFSVGRYDASETLVLDPVLDFSSYLGGNASDIAYSGALDDSLNTYIAGQTLSTNFPTTSNAYRQDCDSCGLSNRDIFVTMVSADGALVLNSTYIGGSGNDLAQSIAVAPSGTAYLTGYTLSGDFPTNGVTPPYAACTTGVVNVFVLVLTSYPQNLQYSTCVGPGRGQDVAVGPGGLAYVVGWTNSPLFPTTSGAEFPTLHSGTVPQGDGFLIKLDTTLGAGGLLYSTYIGGSGDDWANAVAVDAAGVAYIGGSAGGPGFPTTPLALQTTSTASSGFFAKLNPDNSASGDLLYSTLLDGAKDDSIVGIALSGLQPLVYLAGNTTSTNFPTTSNASDRTFGGGNLNEADCVFAVLTPSAPAPYTLSYSTYIGGKGHDLCYGLAVDQSGTAYIAGFGAAQFPTKNALQSRSAGDDDAVLVAIKPSLAGAASLLFSTFLGGSGHDWARDVAAKGPDGVGLTTVAIFGETNSADEGGKRRTEPFPLVRPLQTYGGSGDAFFAKVRFP